jgi:ribokinase
MSAPRLVVIGSSNTDLVVNCSRLPRAGETALGGPLLKLAGGKGANQAVAAARAGARVCFVGAHGTDEFGRAAKAALRAEGVDVRHFISRMDHGSGVALIMVGGSARENLIAVAKSANDSLTREDVLRAGSEISKAGVVVAQLEIPLDAVTAAAELASKHGRPFVLNPAPARKLPARLLRMVHTLTPNETEAAQLTGIDDPVLAARRLRSLGCQRLVVTLGARGALIVDAQGERRIAAPRVKAVDTVGAGDCFTAWLATGLAEGMDLDAAAARAVKAASLCVTRTGAQNAMPRWEELAG